jgi:[acyl-carrier-protein] S-malonyltransferase
VSQIAFLFPGQGAQHVGMGSQLVKDFPVAKQLFEQANDLLGYDLASLCSEGPKEELDLTEISQPAIFVSSLAALEKIRAESPEIVDQCSIAAGLSLGEYTALVFAGVISFEDALRIVQLRGKAMQEASDATPSGMVSALLIDQEKVEELCEEASSEGLIRLANFLCPGNIVVSGSKAACKKFVTLVDEAGGKPMPLAVAGAFHTEIMKPADEKLAEALAGIQLNSPRIPVVSNVDAKPHEDLEEIRDLLVRQVLSPVQWEPSIRYLLEQGVEEFYEIGPGRVLSGLLKRIKRKTPCTVVNDS